MKYPDGRDPREPARWKMGGEAPMYGCLLIIVTLTLVVVALLWWLLS